MAYCHGHVYKQYRNAKLDRLAVSPLITVAEPLNFDVQSEPVFHVGGGGIKWLSEASRFVSLWEDAGEVRRGLFLYEYRCRIWPYAVTSDSSQAVCSHRGKDCSEHHRSAFDSLIHGKCSIRSCCIWRVERSSAWQNPTGGDKRLDQAVQGGFIASNEINWRIYGIRVTHIKGYVDCF